MDLREQIAEAISAALAYVAADGSTGTGFLSAGNLADVTMAKVQPALDAKDARIAELEARVDRFKKQRAGWSGISDLRAEANEYEAERDRLKAANERVKARCHEGRDGPYAIYTNVVKDDILDILDQPGEQDGTG